MGESTKREVIKIYFERIKRYNESRDAIHWISVVLFCCSLMLLVQMYFRASLFLALLLLGIYFLSRPRLPVSEEQIDKWLEEDKFSLLEKAEKKLNLSRGLINSIPLWGSVDRLYRYLEATPPSIDLGDYFSEEGLDKKTRYGIHTFGVIFLSNSSLVYYKCYWNFVKGASIDDEFSEYLYISIASVRYKEKPSSQEEDTKKPEISKKVLYQTLTITSVDSQVTDFPLYEPREVGYNFRPYISDYHPPSEAQKAVHIIQRMVRQRRVDYQRIKSVSEEFQELIE